MVKQARKYPEDEEVQEELRKAKERVEELKKKIKEMEDE